MYSGQDTFYRYLETTAASCPAALIFQASKVGCPIRKSTDQRVFAPPRSLSQRITSFIACACQGIHQLPLRHLIVHIADARGNEPDGDRQQKKDQLLEIYPVPAVKGAIICGKLSVSRDISPMAISEQIFSSRCHAEQALGMKPAANFFPWRMTGYTSFPPSSKGNGGAGRDRTDDPLLAKQVLSQLSYGP
jgi:hypothetical protein